MLKHTDLWNLGAAEMDRVRTASEQESREAVVSLCQAVERDRYVDDEMLMFAGRALGSAGHSGIDDVVMRWFRETRTDRRLEVAGSILRGYWHSSPHWFSSSVVKDVSAALNESPIGSPAWNVALTALAAIVIRNVLPKELGLTSREVLREGVERLARSGANPGLAKMLSVAIA